ncbi:hypothetical protein AG0111_0g985 [Neofusicoccum parvum]|nr:hypothetical protein AG0111_0g985 [Neofusicoccum parvum]
MVTALDAAIIETWTLYSFGTLTIAMRIYCRWRMVGIQNFKPDDFLVVPAWMAYTTMTIAAHIVGGTGDTSHLSMEQRLAMTPEERETRALGSKWFMVGWYTYIALIWTLKMNMLFLYQRVVVGLPVARFIKPAMCFVVVTGVSILILFSTACRPFRKIWQVLPDPGKHCMPQSQTFLITVLTLNLSTDLLIISIPAPVIIPLRTTVWRKLGLSVLFGAGVFIMTAAVLRVVFVLALQSGATAAIWSCREDAVAVFVGQATMIRPAFTREFWRRRAGTLSYPSGGGVSADAKKPSTGDGGFELADGTVGGSGRKKGHRGLARRDPYAVSTVLGTFREGETESMERIVGGGEELGGKGKDGDGDGLWDQKGCGGGPGGLPLVIEVSTNVEVGAERGGSGRPGELAEPGNEDGWCNRHGYGQGYAGRA